MLQEKIEFFHIDEIRNAVPKKTQSLVTQEIIDKLNSIAMSPDEAELYKENIITYSNVLNEGRYKVSTYLNAVRYVGYILAGMSKKDAYMRVFPDKHAALMAQGATNEDYRIRIQQYQNSKIVKALKEQSMIPLYILNMEHRQLAVNRLVQVLKDESVSPKVSVEAADVLLKHLTPPQQVNNQVNVTINQDTSSIIGDLRETMNMIARHKQVEIIEHGNSADIANQTFLTAPVGEEDE